MTPKPKPKKKKSERKLLEAALDKRVSEIVRERDGHCVLCGATEGLTAGHWIHRGKKRVRWDLRNVNCLCRTCNLTDNWQPQHHTAYMIKKHGDAVVLELVELSKGNAFKFSVVELREMLEGMK
jgi:5-methylcytosine-specific restriction endonuclease McrA